ncbi:MAG TPA: copper resistance protein B [Luteimonas sp.]|nr:copper resistance protein B [Luteimonas sp.]
MTPPAFALLAIAAAGIAMPASAQHDAHHEHPAQPDASAPPVADPHAHHGNAMPAPASQPQSPSPFPAPTPAERAAAFPADLEGMDMRAHMDDNPLVAVFRGDRLEHGDGDALGWDLRAGVGRNFDKLWLRSEGERRDGRLEHARTELSWSRATGPWWDRTIGLRHDAGSGGVARDWAAIGVQGLAPYKFEFEATGYVGTAGRLAARVEGEYEILLTNRLILQPKLEANFYSRDDEDNRLGKGLSDASFGLRLRYEFSPRFAPYVGHVWTRCFGDTADLVEAAGHEAGEHGWVAGVRFWF